MGKTKNQTPSIGRFSHLRTRPPAPKVVSKAQVLFDRQAGFADLSAYRDSSVLPQELLSAVAPLGAVYSDRDAAISERLNLLVQFSERVAHIGAFLPEPYDRGSTRVTSRVAEAINRGQNNDLLGSPLEVIVPEEYSIASWTKATRYALAHYVYDPLTDHWFLLRRWGLPETVGEGISLYLEPGLDDQLQEIKALLERIPLSEAESFPLASAAVLNQARRQREHDG